MKNNNKPTLCIDYDGTFTKISEELDTLAIDLKIKEWNVIGCTMRYPEERDFSIDEFEKLVNKLYFTSRKAKKPFLENLGIKVDIWIDDQPEFILCDSI